MILACPCGASEVDKRSSVGHVVQRADKGVSLTTSGYLCNGCRHYLTAVPTSQEVATWQQS